MTKRVLVPKSSVWINGEYFVSRKAAALHFGVEYELARGRLMRGWTLEQAFGVHPSPTAEPEDFVGIVYVISNTRNKKVYVGITTNSLDYRISQHLKLYANGTVNKLYDAMREIGAHRFRIQEVARVTSRLELRNTEKQFIEKHNSIDRGYNTAFGGAPYGRVFREITINGRRFSTISKAATELGIHENAIYTRLRDGRSLDGIKPRQKRRVL